MAVKVGCRILNGITINLDHHGQVTLDGPPLHGDIAFDAQGRQNKAGNQDSHSFTGSQPNRGPYGVTTVTDEQWAEITRMHAASDWMVRGMVFRVTW